MRVFAVHDARGDISQLVTCPEHQSQPFLSIAPGFSITEVRLPEGLAITDDDGTGDGLTELMRNYRIELAPQKVALVRVES